MKSVITYERLLLLGILLLSIAFRIAQFDTSFFGPEQAWIAHDGLKLAKLQAFTTYMNPSSAGYHNFPLTHYLAAIPFVFSDDIFALFLFYVVVNLIAVWLCWLFVRRYWGWQVAALATIVYASMPYAVFFSYRIWNNTLMPPFIMLWALGCGFAFQERRPRGLILAWAAAMLAFQLHISAIVFVFILVVMMWFIRLPNARRYALVGSSLALIPALPWFYAQISGAAQLGLDFSMVAGRTGLQMDLSKMIQFLSARDLAWNFTSVGAEGLARKLTYMQYLGIIWLLIFTGSVLVITWQAWQGSSRDRRLYSLLVLWCLLPMGFTVVSAAPYTIIYYLVMLPAPCIVLGLTYIKAIRWQRWLKVPMMLGLLVLCTLNWNAVWSIEQYVRRGFTNGEPTTHAFSLDHWYYSDPLVWQLDIVADMRELLEDGEAAEVFLLQETFPDEDHIHLRRPFSYHLHGYDVRAINIYSPHHVYPENPALFLRDVTDVTHNGGYEDLLEFLVSVGPYRLYLLPDGVSPEPLVLLPNRPAYENGIRLTGFDELRCNGIWQLHWTPGPAEEEGDPVHFFVHLLDGAGEGLAHSDLRTYDAWEWRAGDHIVTAFDFGQELGGLPIETLRVGLYYYSDETKAVGSNISALDELGRPWLYAIDIPFGGVCSP